MRKSPSDDVSWKEEYYKLLGAETQGWNVFSTSWVMQKEALLLTLLLRNWISHLYLLTFLVNISLVPWAVAPEAKGGLGWFQGPSADRGSQGINNS